MALRFVALLIGVSLVLHASNASAQSAEASPQLERPATYCVWPAVGGALAGVAVAWYGFVGVRAIGGHSPFDIESTLPNVLAIAALEYVGLVGGATAACGIWGNEQRWLPTAAFVITGGALGAAALGGTAFLIISSSSLDSSTDSPVASTLIILGSVVLGVVGGGYLGYAFDRAVRGAPGERNAPALTMAPVASHDFVGAAALLRF